MFLLSLSSLIVCHPPGRLFYAATQPQMHGGPGRTIGVGAFLYRAHVLRSTHPHKTQCCSPQTERKECPTEWGMIEILVLRQCPVQRTNLLVIEPQLQVELPTGRTFCFGVGTEE